MRRNVSRVEFQDLLNNISSTLERLIICEVVFVPELDESNIRIVTLPVLTSLRIDDALIFPSLETPCLQRIYMGSVDRRTAESFAQRCSSSEIPLLTSLEFFNMDLSIFEHKFTMLSGLRNLEVLEFRTCIEESAFLELLQEGKSFVPVEKEKGKKNK
jgi:hypothetical protein